MGLSVALCSRVNAVWRVPSGERLRVRPAPELDADARWSELLSRAGEGAGPRTPAPRRTSPCFARYSSPFGAT